jgi:hypothetical protein
MGRQELLILKSHLVHMIHKAVAHLLRLQMRMDMGMVTGMVTRMTMGIITQNMIQIIS